MTDVEVVVAILAGVAVALRPLLWPGSLLRATVRRPEPEPLPDLRVAYPPR